MRHASESRDGNVFISGDPRWIRRISRVAADAESKLFNYISGQIERQTEFTENLNSLPQATKNDLKNPDDLISLNSKSKDFSAFKAMAELLRFNSEFISIRRHWININADLIVPDC